MKHAVTLWALLAVGLAGWAGADTGVTRPAPKTAQTPMTPETRKAHQGWIVVNGLAVARPDKAWDWMPVPVLGGKYVAFLRKDRTSGDVALMMVRAKDHRTVTLRRRFMVVNTARPQSLRLTKHGASSLRLSDGISWAVVDLKGRLKDGAGPGWRACRPRASAAASKASRARPSMQTAPVSRPSTS